MAPTQCPSCGMGFASETSVLKHMNHQFSRCKFFFLRKVPPAHCPDTPLDPLPTSPDCPPTPPDPLLPRSVDFPDASFVYSCSNGFMGNFYDDTHAEERASNIYFPFQSKGEWEVASFLSSSGLSMKRIDEFLSLSMVSSGPIFIDGRFSQISLSRSPAWASLSIVPGHCVALSRCFLVAHLGNRQSSPFLAIPRRLHLFYTIAIPSSVSNQS